MINWWAVTSTRLEHPAYQALTSVERLYLEYVISDYSLRGPFYKSDLEVAVTLAVSEDKVRRARRRIGAPAPSAMLSAAMLAGRELQHGLGWIVYVPGWKRGSKSLATQYAEVPIAEVPKGAFFATVHRHTFEMLLGMVRAKILRQSDVVVWIVLSYLYHRFRGKHDDHHFFVTKDELRHLSGVVNTGDAIARLHDKWTFSGGEHLFEYKDQHQRVAFTKWAWCSDPSEDDGAAKSHDNLRREIAGIVKAKKTKPTTRPLRKVAGGRRR